MLEDTPFSYLAYICDHMKIRTFGLEDWNGVLWISPTRHESLAQIREKEKWGGLEMTGKIKSGHLLRRAQSLPCGITERGEPAGLSPFQGWRNRDADGNESEAGKRLESKSWPQCPILHCHTLRMIMDGSITAQKGNLQFTLASNDFGQSRGMGMKHSPRALSQMEIVFLCSLEKATKSCRREVSCQVLLDAASSLYHSESMPWSRETAPSHERLETPSSWQLWAPSS